MHNDFAGGYDESKAHNLIWVFGYSGNGGNMAAWYPGDSYVDLLGAGADFP